MISTDRPLSAEHDKSLAEASHTLSVLTPSLPLTSTDKRRETKADEKWTENKNGVSTHSDDVIESSHVLDGAAEV